MRSTTISRAVAVVGMLLASVGAAQAKGEDVRAKALYVKQCAACHGTDGRGDGPAAYLLYPKPRDFRTANYRFVSTWEKIPTDDDLLRVITRGVPGSGMPSWEYLPEADRRALVRYLKSLAPEPLVVPPSKAPGADGSLGTGLLVVPLEPADARTNLTRGAQLFADACASCHGPRGRGDGENAANLRDVEGYPTRPRDLTTGVFKTDPSPEQLYRRILIGLPGTPMPANDWAYGDDGWYLVQYVLSLSSPVRRDRAEMRRYEIEAPRVAHVPQHPDDGAWTRAQPFHLHLMPLWWRYDRPEELTVQALHDGREVALLLTWNDLTYDATAMRPQDFRDAVAVEFSLASDPPFFAMGQPGAPVNVWMWKAERQADLEPAFQDLEKIYPNIGIDSYPNPLASPLEQPVRHALTLDTPPLFVTAWGAGNIVADPKRAAAVEDLRAEGFGTLRARPPVDQAVDADGRWDIGTYRVVLRRTLTGRGKDAVTLAPGRTVPLAFAVWDGSAGDRDGKKSVTVWQDLRLLVK